MPVIFKPVGYIDNNKFEISYDTSEKLRLETFEKIFENYGLTNEEVKKIKFVANSETIKNNEKVFEISDSEKLSIFVFSPVKSIKDKLEYIFTKNFTNLEKNIQAEIKPILKLDIVAHETTPILNSDIVEPYIQKSIDKAEEISDIHTLDDSIINLINEKTSKLFENKDFKHLIRIYYSNQEIFTTFLQFITHGDIVKINIPNSEETNKTYEKEIAIFRNLGIKESDENIKMCLANFNGHLNLTLRALLCRKAVMETTLNIEEI
jgi:hypothetical protein